MSDDLAQARFESAALLARHEALLERVTVLERALEEIAELPNKDAWLAVDIARGALDA